MLTRRTRIVFRHEFFETWKKPLFRILVALLVLTSWGFSNGGMQIQSGDTTVGGGARAWVTSEFSFALLLTFLVPMLYGFFGSIASGVAILSDDEARISDMLLSTPLSPSEYLSNVRAVRTGPEWKVTFEIKNAGTGKMPVDLAAVRGERFDDQGKPKPRYLDARARVVLGAGETRKVEILCGFEPERVVADPDVQVLQLRRRGAGV